MNNKELSSNISKGLVEPEDQEQRDRAVDPACSCIVQAPAGSGKTTLLVERFLALLNQVTKPEEILAITFTRKAAKEMRGRVLAELQKENPKEIAKKVLKRSSERDWNLIENPQRMRIQTIDSFVDGLVRQLPYQSRLNLVYDKTESASSLFEQAASMTLERIAGSPSDYANEIADMVGLLNNDHQEAQKLLAQMLDKREHWLETIGSLVSDTKAVKEQQTGIADLIDESRQKFIQSLCDSALETIGKAAMKIFKRILPRTAENMELEIDDAKDLSDPNVWNHFVNDLILTNDGKLRKRVNVANGFPPKEKQLKESWSKAIESLSPDFDEKVVARIRNLPPKSLSVKQREALSNIAISLIGCAQDLNKVFENNESVDFTETSIAARRALQVEDAPTELALALDYRIRHILVDEFQDTSTSQNELLNLLMEGWQPNDGNTFFAVGDPMQSIYGFRKADLTNFLNATEEGMRNRRLETLNLTSNFRSDKRLVEFCNGAFETILGNVSDLESGKVAFSPSVAMDKADTDADHGLFLCASEDQYLEASIVAEKVASIRKKYPLDSIAILFRTRTNLHPYFEELRLKGIRWNAVEMETLADVPVVKDLWCLTYVLTDVEDYERWLAVLMSPLVGLDLQDVEILAERGRQNRPVDMLLNSRDLPLSDEGHKILGRVQAPIYQALQTQNRGLRSRVERLFYQLGGANAYDIANHPLSQETTKTNAERYFDLLEKFSSEVVEMDLLSSAVDETYASAADELADVEIMTVHKAKGLEFDHVLIPYLNKGKRADQEQLIYLHPISEGLVVTSNSTFSADPLHRCVFDTLKERQKNEEARLLYVAATRAKRSLWLYGTVKEPNAKPHANTNLATMREAVPLDDWEIVKQELPDSDTEEGSEDRDISAEVEDNEASITRYRVDPDFRFEAPKGMPEIHPGSMTSGFSTRALSNGLGLEPSEAQKIGDIVHAELHRRVECRDLSASDETRVTLWRNLLRSEGFETRAINQMIETIQDQIARTLDSDIGRWLLNPDHQASESEVARTLVVQGVPRNFVLDRSFVVDGIRYVIDYKTSRFPADNDDLVEIKAYDHQLQLIRYAILFENEDSRPVKAAIYFSDIAEFVEVDISDDARKVFLKEQYGIESTVAIDNDLFFTIDSDIDNQASRD